MFQKDYILRMIEEIGRFLTVLSGLKKKKEHKKAYEEFLEFISTHLKIEEDELSTENLTLLEKKLESGLSDYPDELAQLLMDGGELSSEAGKRDVTEVLYLLSWNSYRKAEEESGAYRFNRMVEMNSLKERLALMGINV
ncbi:hypothetical protein [Marinilabilia salmonicolor]|jgi:hypothetical protein|uniref:Uncharacterized protein n=1 Tax=Marinilabilia salmonicolor TaxID=989 RepID=A0A368UN17_9BACT|nr:hypothetical protein [Marinilabilia salmonicolor]RCW30188.1 hypothetical protein DFO77_12313 [Marinilabilia salmonicolor]